MFRVKKFTQILIAVVLLCLLGASAAAAQPEGFQSGFAQNAVSLPGMGSAVIAIQPESGGSAGPAASIFPNESENGICYTNGFFCYNDWTGRWIMTYYREGEDHWVTKCLLYVPDFIDNELDAQAWRWSDEYVAEHCSLEGESQTWQGTYLYTQKETIHKCISPKFNGET